MESPPPGFEWDPRMNERCDEQWFFTFFDAARIFSDEEFDFLNIGPKEFRYPDGRVEERHVAIGMLERSSLIIAVVYTMREGRRRIITAHPAPEKQRAAFRAHNGIV